MGSVYPVDKAKMSEINNEKITIKSPGGLKLISLRLTCGSNKILKCFLRNDQIQHAKIAASKTKQKN